MSEPRRRRGSRRDSEIPEKDEAQLIAELRARSWQKLRPPPPPAPEPEPVLAPASEQAEPLPANDASPTAPPKKKRTRKEPVRDLAPAFRRAAWAWLHRPRAPVAAAVPEAPAAVTPTPPPPSPPRPRPAGGVRKTRPRRDPTLDLILGFRRSAWAWFAPRATGEAAAGTHAPVRAVSPDAAVPGGEVVRSHLRGVIEALLFASEHPLPAKELARIAQADLKVVKSLLGELVEEYRPRGFRLDEVANGFVFRTSPVFAPFVREQVQKKPVKMTRAQIETLAIVAYRQPITRPEVDEVRGVDSGAVLKSLLERELVRIIGKKDEPGRPMLYGTTGTFLEFFGLKALGDLPTLREFTELTDESRRTYEREMGEEPPDAGVDMGGLMGEGEMRAPAPPPPPPPPPEAYEDPEPASAEVSAEAPASTPEPPEDAESPASTPEPPEDADSPPVSEPRPSGSGSEDAEEDEDEDDEDEDEDDDDEDDEDEDEDDEDDEDEDEDDEDDDDDDEDDEDEDDE